MEVAQNFQTDPSTLNNLYVKSSNGTQVPLGMLAHWEQSRAQLSIGTKDSFPPPSSASTLLRARLSATPSKAVNRVEQRIQMPTFHQTPASRELPRHSKPRSPTSRS